MRDASTVCVCGTLALRLCVSIACDTSIRTLWQYLSRVVVSVAILAMLAFDL